MLLLHTGACVKILFHSQIFAWPFGSHVTISPLRPVSFTHIVRLLFSPLPSDMYGLILVSLWILSPPFGYWFLWGYLPSFLLLAYLSFITHFCVWGRFSSCVRTYPKHLNVSFWQLSSDLLPHIGVHTCRLHTWEMEPESLSLVPLWAAQRDHISKPWGRKEERKGWGWRRMG